MLKRKIEQYMNNWKNIPNRKPLIIKGCRQCGKTYSVLNFARQNYKHVVYLNFFENPTYASVFSGSLEIDNITLLLSALLGKDAIFVPGETILILDEIQDCPDARTALKFFRIDGRYDVIGTGSLLGVKGYGKEPKSVPVGSETIIDMYPLDFEEFLWANDINESVITLLTHCLEENKPVPEALHSKMNQLLLQYTVVGGMPEAVQSFINNFRMDEVLQIQRDIIRSYEDDMVKYAEKKDKSRIKECFEGNLYGYKGAIFENLIADIFSKMGRKLYYFHKDSGLEVDFVCRYKGHCTLVEVKAATGNTKSTRTILRHPEKYHVYHAIKLGNYNVGYSDQILTLPLYMAFLLRSY